MEVIYRVMSDSERESLVKGKGSSYGSGLEKQTEVNLNLTCTVTICSDHIYYMSQDVKFHKLKI